jgi:hypothetical protein
MIVNLNDESATLSIKFRQEMDVVHGIATYRCLPVTASNPLLNHVSSRDQDRSDSIQSL